LTSTVLLSHFDAPFHDVQVFSVYEGLYGTSLFHKKRGATGKKLEKKQKKKKNWKKSRKFLGI